MKLPMPIILKLQLDTLIIINQFQLVDYKENIKRSTYGGVCRKMIQLHVYGET